MVYSGKIVRKQEPKSVKTDFMPLVFWAIGVLFSFIPLFIDVCIFLKDHSSLTFDFWLKVCLRGDLLCIIATVLVLSIMESTTKHKSTKSKIDTIAIWIGMLLCMLMFAVWTIFKYDYPENYNGVFPVVITVIFFIVGFSISSRLQIRLLEVDRNV